MIFINRHPLFHALAYTSSSIEHPHTKIWWAKRAVASYEAVRVEEETNREKIARKLNILLDHPLEDIDFWTAHYLPQVRSSIAAVEMAMQRGLPVHIAIWHREASVQDDVIDWLNMLATQNHPLFKKLSRINWDQAVVHARRWRDLNERRHAKIAGTEGTTEILKLGRFCWYRLDSIQAIRREGEAMRNCLASGQYNHVHDLPGHGAYDGLYSLRDGKGRSCLTTLLWRGNATQAYERANRPVSPELRPNLKALEEYIRQNQGEGTTANQEGQTSN